MYSLFENIIHHKTISLFFQTWYFYNNTPCPNSLGSLMKTVNKAHLKSTYDRFRKNRKLKFAQGIKRICDPYCVPFAGNVDKTCLLCQEGAYINRAFGRRKKMCKKSCWQKCSTLISCKSNVGTSYPISMALCSFF